jgi:hypothetical protein
VGNRLYRAILLIGLSFGLCGCVTSKLWEDNAFDGFNTPASPANLQVSRCENDWLVQYDEVNDDSARIRRRAYFLYANDERVRGHKTPHFVTVIVTTSGEGRAVISDSGPEFTLYDADTLVGTYALPVYAEPSGRVKQILLTPLTVVADVATVGACGALYIGYLWLQSGASCPH